MILHIAKSFLRGYFIHKNNRPVISWDGTSKSRYRVWPHLIDYNIHLNNAKYLRLMEHARWSHITDLGWFYKLATTQTNLVISAMEITFIRELSLMLPFEIHSTLLTWDEKYLYVEQKFIVKGKVYGHALVKFAAVRKGKRVYSEALCATLGLNYTDTVTKDKIEHWNAMSAAKRASVTKK